MAMAAVTSLMRTIEIEFLQFQQRPIVEHQQLASGNKDVIKSLLEKLEFLVASMEEFDEKKTHEGDGAEGMKVLLTKLKDVSLRAEDEIESELAEIYLTNPTPRFLVPLWGVLRIRQVLQRAIETIDPIKEDFVRMKIKYAHDQVKDKDVQGREYESTKHVEEILVGKSDEVEMLKELLVSGQSQQREVVSIRGMGGIGKTTLARKVYEDPSIKLHFDKQAWVVVSQHRNRRQILLCLLDSVCQTGKEINAGTTDEQLAEKLYQHLMRQRYLVVLDDMWSSKTWYDVQACFPEDRMGSRILVTTRLNQLLDHISSGKLSHQMRLLDENESWDLFYEKALPEEGEFERIGRKVVENCRGLPLAIIVAAGLFSKLKTLKEWKNAAYAISSLSTTTIAEQCSKILSLSYHHLPHKLKACFLYLGVFPQNSEIVVRMLTRLWVAEGLIRADNKSESSERLGRRHLQELIDRNLVVASEQNSKGEIKTCKMHDLLHVLSRREAHNENLLYTSTESASTDEIMDFSPENFRWVNIPPPPNQKECTLHASFNNPRSILGLYRDNEKGGAGRTVLHLHHQISQNFRLLRVLDLASFHWVNGINSWIKDLVHLRYLSFSTNEPLHTIGLHKAWNLETLFVRWSELGTKDTMLPYHIWELPQLRHIYCHPYCVIPPPNTIPQNLHTISSLTPFYNAEKLFANIPHLKKLSINASPEGCVVWADCLSTLHQLESLYIRLFIFNYEFNYPETFIHRIASLQNLHKLKLEYTHLEWRDMNVLGTLPCLEVLKLEADACRGEEWELSEEEEGFCELKLLKISATYLTRWIASPDHFPKLERLILDECRYLEEIPTGFADIIPLQLIKLTFCLPSALKSAMQIQSEQHEQGNSNMLVIDSNTLVSLCLLSLLTHFYLYTYIYATIF